MLNNAIQMEIYELLQLCRYELTIDRNITETFKTIVAEFPELDKIELHNYISTKANEIYAGEFDK